MQSSKLGYLNIGPMYLLKWRVSYFKMYRLSSSRKMHKAQVNTTVLVLLRRSNEFTGRVQQSVDTS